MTTESVLRTTRLAIPRVSHTSVSGEVQVSSPPLALSLARRTVVAGAIQVRVTIPITQGPTSP